MSFKTNDDIHVFTRDDWGAAKPHYDYSPIGRLTTAVYHHAGPDIGGPPLKFKTAAAEVRGYQSFHQNQRGWIDIGYHLLFDALGRVYVGRPASAMGAHVEAANTGRLGLNFMQDGRRHGLTRGQKETLLKLLTHPHAKLGIPALGELKVLGHREVPGQATECPGDRIARDVHKILRNL